MALNTPVARGGAAGGTGSIAIASVALTAGRKYYLACYNYPTSGTSGPNSITGQAAGSWTQINTTRQIGSSGRFSLWELDASVTETVTITLAFPVSNYNGTSTAGIYEVSSTDATVVTVQSGYAANSGSGTLSVTLSAFGNAANLPMGFGSPFREAGGQLVAGSGFTLLTAYASNNGNNDVVAEHGAANDNVVDVTTSANSYDNGLFAIEIGESGGGGALTVSVTDAVGATNPLDTIGKGQILGDAATLADLLLIGQGQLVDEPTITIQDLLATLVGIGASAGIDAGVVSDALFAAISEAGLASGLGDVGSVTDVVTALLETPSASIELMPEALIGKLRVNRNRARRRR